MKFFLSMLGLAAAVAVASTSPASAQNCDLVLGGGIFSDLPEDVDDENATEFFSVVRALYAENGIPVTRDRSTVVLPIYALEIRLRSQTEARRVVDALNEGDIDPPFAAGMKRFVEVAAPQIRGVWDACGGRNAAIAANCDDILEVGIFELNTRPELQVVVLARILQRGFGQFEQAGTAIRIPQYGLLIQMPDQISADEVADVVEALNDPFMGSPAPGQYSAGVEAFFVRARDQLIAAWQGCLNQIGLNASVEHLVDPRRAMLIFRFSSPDTTLVARLDPIFTDDRELRCSAPAPISVPVGISKRVACNRSGDPGQSELQLPINADTQEVRPFGRVILPEIVAFHAPRLPTLPGGLVLESAEPAQEPLDFSLFDQESCPASDVATYMETYGGGDPTEIDIAPEATVRLLGDRLGLSIASLDPQAGLVEMTFDGTNSSGASQTLTLSAGGSFDVTRCNTEITISVISVSNSSVKTQILTK